MSQNNKGLFALVTLFGIIAGAILASAYYQGKNILQRKSEKSPSPSLEGIIDSLKNKDNAQQKNANIHRILKEVKIEKLAEFLKHQPSKAISLILSGIEENRAASILQVLPLDKQTEILRHLHEDLRCRILEEMEKNDPALAAQLKVQLEEAPL